MHQPIKKVGVIGAGVMGATIAAHCANVGLETLLLDILPPGEPKGPVDPSSRGYRNLLAQKGLEGALRSKPASFYIPEDASLITVGNLEDDLPKLAGCDWVVEVVVERLDVKKELLSRLEKVVGPDALVSTNTSGISIAAMSSHLSPEFQARFMGTHFFNPPRYMRLFEIIPGPKTTPEAVERMAWFAENRLGKGVVFAKDTPNFIANRIGVFGMGLMNQLVSEMDMTIEEVDALTGPVIGRPKMATFKLADLVGLDVLGHVAGNVFQGAPEDERREIFDPPKWLLAMVDKGWLGGKSGQGFYKKTRDAKGRTEYLVLDLKTLEHRPKQKPNLPELEQIKQLPGTAAKLKALYFGQGKSSEFTFKHLTETLIYAARRIPEISDDIVNIDNAMRWGFNWKWGPFETWDVLGLGKSLEAMQAAGYAPPQWVLGMAATKAESFYKTENGKRLFYDPASREYREQPLSPGIILLGMLKDQGKLIMGNKGASLIDLGGGVACLEFHSKMNSLGADVMGLVDTACDIVSKDYEGLVFANQGANFSVGANLMMVLFTAQEEEWDELEWMVKKFQDTLMKVKYLDKPVVAAPHQMALGGGCETCLAADRVVAAAETYLGLVEAGVGVIPAGGGTKELMLRNGHERLFKIEKGGLYPKQIDLLPFMARAFETIAMAKVSTSAKEAVKLGYLRPTDKVCINNDLRIQMAKDNVLAMAMGGYDPPRPPAGIRVMGRDAMGLLKYALYNMHKAGLITDHDVTVSTKLAQVITGGEVLPDTEVTEQYLLDLEREAFLWLCGTRETQARMAHMLKTGKPLRN